MSTRLRAGKNTAIGAVAACAVIGATSPVWAGTSSAPTPAPAANTTTTSADQVRITALQLQVAKLKAALADEQAALQAAAKSDRTARRSARDAREAASRWKLKSEHAKVRVVTVGKPVPTTDPAANNSNPCHHDGTDPGDWKDGKDHWRGGHHHGHWHGDGR